ncbi:MAG: tyrosine-type recombinase/integrase [Candidatus Contendobacter sp.]|nr:tyrosine-type recombinase/integrase [Candidatus Contendobacter sp.]
MGVKKLDDGINSLDGLSEPARSIDTPPALPTAVREYVHAATAPRTRQAYRDDLARFLAWGGRVPSSPEAVAAYLATHGESHAPATLGRWAVSLGRAHTSQGLADPCRDALVRATLRGIRRQRGTAPRQVTPLEREALLALLAPLGASPRDARDRALLLLGFSAALRRSELVALTTADVAFGTRGLTVTIRRSKTDQEGVGRVIGIPWARGPVCPVRALQAWLATAAGLAAAAPATPTPLFRPIDRHGRLAPQALSGHAVAAIVKQRAAAAGLDPAEYSGHSLRAGFCTAAARHGAPTWRIQRISGHRTHASLERYIRAGQLFDDHPLEGLF